MKTNFNKPNPKRLLGYLVAAAMMVFSFNATAQCTDVTVTLYDSYGDGGGEITVDGNVLTNSGASASMVVCVDLSGCVDITYASTDSWSYENSWDVVDGSGALLASGADASGNVGNCAPPPVPGCMDSTATNYDPAADTDDGSCTYPCLDNAVVYTAGSYAGENSFTITDCSGAVLAEMTSGYNGFDQCIVLPAVYSVNLSDSYGDTWNGGTLSIDGVVYEMQTMPFSANTESFQVGGACPVYGCTDSTAANFDAAADTDDGSCTYGVPGCTDATACNFDAAATADDGSCTFATAGYDCNGDCLVGDAVTLNLYDSYGDGWNGGIMTVNGVDYTIATGASASFALCMDLTVCTDLIYTAGSWSTENSWDLVDASGAVLASGGNNSGILGNAPGFDCAGACLSGDLVTVTLYDSYGDGGGQITVDGNVLTNSGTSNSMSICVDLSVCTDIIYVSTDSWPFENSWDVVDASGAVIASGADASGDVGACAVYGCTDPAANNYDPAANTDDGSCVVCTDNWVTITCGGGSFQSEVSWTLLNSSGTAVLTGGAGVFGAPFSTDLCLPSDCYTVDMVDSYGDGWNGNVFEISMMGASIGTATISTGSTGTADISVGATCPVFGCTDAAAVNYDASANTDDGSCQYSCTAAPYCENFDLGVGTWTNNGWVNNAMGTTSGSTGPSDDITVGGFYMYYETSTGYAPSVDITSECLDISSLANPTLSFYNHMYGATTGDLNVYVNGNLEWTMSGDQGNQWNWVQVDLSAYAGIDVTIMIEAVYGGSFTGDIAIDNVCVDELLFIDGCTDPTALNYDASANNDDGSCTYCAGTFLSLNMSDSYGDGWNGASWTATGNSTGNVYGPFTIGSGAAATEMICFDDDCYDIVVGGGTWDGEVSWTVTDASGAILASAGDAINGGGAGTFQGGLGVNVTCPVYGCTDATALNFDSIADTDDGSCAYLCDVYVASASVDASPSCNGAFDASATCYIAGSFGGDFYQWNDPNGQTGSTATGLAAGTYTCTATDSVNGCVSVATVVIDPTPVISISAFVADATPGNTNGSVDLTVSGGTPCYNGAAMSLAGASATSTQWASNAFDVIATSDLQITSIDQPFMSGAGTADVYYRLGSGSGFEADPNGWMLAGSASISTTFIGDINNIPVSINVNAGETVCIYVQGIGVNTVFGAGVDSTYNSAVSSDANLSIIGGFATGGAPGSGTTYPSAGSYDFGGNINYSLSSYTYAWSNGATSEDATGLGLGPISVTVTDCNGCTGSWTGFVLTNYVYGCMDTLASNYDASANTDDGSCLYDGCTDPLANNYDASSNNDDGSCTYSCAYYGWDAELTVTFAPDWYSDENSWYIINALTGDTVLASQSYASGGAVDVQTLCAMNGCYYVDGYDSFGDGWGFGSGTLDIVDASGNSVLAGFTLSGGTSGTSDVFSVGGSNCTAGCTDTAYTNFDVNAVLDDGSCSDSIVGCTDPAASNYTPFSNYDDGSCCYDNLVSVAVGGGSWLGEVGWTLSLDTTIYASGGAPYAADLCLPDGCYTVDMTDSYGDGWNGSTFDVDGVALGGLTSGSAGSFTFEVGTGSCAVFGCTDPAASNFDATATDDDGSCCLDNLTSITTGIDYLGTAYDWEFNGMEWAVTLLGDTVPSGIGSNDLGGISFGGSADLCLPDGCYEFDATDASGFGVYAWFNINGTQYDPPSSGGTYGLPYNMYFEVGAATCPIMGCTDPNSADYDSTATYDDGSCTYPCLDTEVSLNLYDSYGDGWNGGILTVNGVDYTVTAGSFASFVLCLDLSGCIDVIYTAGSWSTENSWDITDSSGAVIASGPNASGTVGNGCIYLGCTDPAAFNYDPTANTDDGSCNYCADNTLSMVTTDAYGLDWGWTYGYAASWTITDLYDPTNTVSGPVNTGVNISNLGVESADVCLADGCYEVVTTNLYTTYDSYLTWDFAGATGGVNTTAYVAVGAATCPVMGCTDTNAVNYDATATYDDGSCTYPCYDNLVSVSVDGGSWQTEVGWTLSLDTVIAASGGAPYAADLCLPDGCYTVDMTDSYGDGWNGNAFVATSGGAVIGSGGLTAGASGSFDISIGGVACPVYGCTDTTAANYDAAADTDDGSCDYLGCTNPTATNYDATATIDDGSCAFGCTLDEVTLVLTDSYGDGWNGNSLTIDGVDYTIAGFAATESFTNICIDLTGCTDVIYNATGTYTYENSWEVLDASGAVIASGGDNSGTVGSGCPVYGCTDPLATNYDASANTDDGSCSYSGCTDPAATNYNANATTDDGSCVYPCLDNVVLYTAGSWSSENDFTITDCAGNVIASMTAGAGFDQCIDLGTDYSVNLVDTYGDGWNGGSLSIDGVTYTLDGINDDGASASFQVGFCAVNGCTDPTATNYDASANTDDGSCTYCVDGCMDATQFNYDPNATCDDGSCIPYTYGCTDATASNYNSTVNTDDGSCIWLGCMDANADNYDATATVDDGSCTYTTVSGCTDPTADNYDATATVDDGSCTYPVVDGCTDPTADNYDASATNDDGSCTYIVCNEDAPTGAVTSELTHDRVRITWDNMNSTTCMVEQYRIRYREAGTSAWSSKTMAGSGLCQFGLNTTTKKILGLTPSTTYEYYMKAWYCGGGSSAWSALQNFTTQDVCENVINFAVSTPTTTKATFAWDLPASAYSFARIKLRPDTTGGAWTTAGGFGVFYPATDKDKNGLTPGQTYRASARTWCDPNGGTYRSAGWTSPIFWTQPTSVRIDGGAAIANLDVYPNPSRDVFNVAFTSEDVQDLEVRVINVVGEVVYTENLQQFVGEYTKSLDLGTYTKGVYFLEITTNDGVVNKKLILQ